MKLKQFLDIIQLYISKSVFKIYISQSINNEQMYIHGFYANIYLDICQNVYLCLPVYLIFA